MNQQNIKIAYQNSKINREISQAERLDLGYREIQTLKLLATEIGYDIGGSKSLLDLGCADRFLENACQIENWIYQGLDYSDVNFEIDNFPIKDNSIDIIISLAVIEHLFNPEKFINQIFRCLKPGGLIYLSTPNFQLDWKNFYNDPTHVRPYTPISLEQMLKLHNFNQVNTFPGLRCKDIKWYRGRNRFIKAYYLLPFRRDTMFPAPDFLRGHARSIFALGLKVATKI
jgi:SAM-dependent methyltransferase